MPESADNEQLAVSYAALILQDEGIDITADKITALVKAANVEVEAYWPQLFAKALQGRDVIDLILSSGGGGGAGPAAPAAAGDAAAAAAPEPEPEPEPEEESDEEMGFGLFD